MTRPLVSVCIPTRNQARWLGETLDSVFAQTLQDFEVVVADDASDDETPELVARRGEERLYYLRHERRLGVAANRNSCLEAARGRYIAWLDSDDLYHRDMLATQVKALEGAPRAAFAHSGFEVIDENGDPLPGWTQPFAADVVEPGPVAFGELALRNYIAAPTVLVRTRAHHEAGPYRESLATGEDWDMWLRLALEGDLVFTARPLARYRWHTGSLTRTAEASCAQLERDYQVITGIFRGHAGGVADGRRLERRARTALAARAVRRATDFLTRGERRLVLACLSLAWRSRPALALDATVWRLALAGVRGAEYAWHGASRLLLGRLAEELQGTRIAIDLRRAATPDPAWEQTLRRIARTVRQVVPPSAPIAVVDKWDPTLLHLSGRSGWHYPDRATMHDGYPPDSDIAVDHLEDLRSQGARYLVLPSSAFWWLEHYPGLARHLARAAERRYEDEHCVIYRLRAVQSLSRETTDPTCKAESS